MGNVVSKEGVRIDPQKLEVVENWVRPCSVTHVRSFMGPDSYYRRLVKSFASNSNHLTNITKKEVLFEWTSNCQETFQKPKTLLTTAPVLALPVHGKDFIINCDPSHSILGVVLMLDKNLRAYALC